MAVIKYQEHTIALAKDETVLEGLLRHSVDVPYGCQAGACQACMLKVNEGTAPQASQKGLTPAQQSLGYFLSCSCQPTEDLTIALPTQAKKVSTEVVSKEILSGQIIRLRLQKPFEYIPGQFISLWKDDETFRSYSLASSCHQDPYIELHIKYIPDGCVSRWIHDDIHAGDSITIQGPLGHCIYTNQTPGQTLLLAGIGTGLAPLYGIARDALLQNHTGKIHLVTGAKSQDNHYLTSELEILARRYTNFTVSQLSQDTENGDIYEHIKTTLPSTKDIQIFLCGAASFVQKMKRQCFMSGAAMKDIHADVFLPSGKA